MNERLIPVGSFYLDGQADADGVAGVYVPEAMILTHVSAFVTLAGSPGTATIDIQVEGTDVQAAIDISSNGLTALTVPGYRVAAGEVVEIDLNLAEGTTPTATGEIVLWGLVAE
jgi:hypothetical protein